MVAHPFGLNEEVAKCGMLSVRVERLQHDLGVARELELARDGGPVGDRHAPDLRGVVGRYHDLHPRVDVAIPAMELDTIAGKRDMIRVSVDGHRLVGGAPYTPTRHVLDVYPLAVVVTRRVAAPACHHDIAVTTVTAAGVRDERSVWNVAEQCDTWLGRVRRIRFPYGWLRDFHRCRRNRLVLVAGTLHYQASWNAFLKNQVVGADQRIRMKTPLPHLTLQCVGECHQTHPDVVCHVRSNHRARGSRIRTRVVDGVTEAVRPQRSFTLEQGEVADRLMRLDQHREHGRVRRDNQGLVEPALEREIRHTETAILIYLIPVAHVVCRFGYSPRSLSLRTVQNLSSHRTVVGLIQQRERVRLGHEYRHEVLEHAAAPRSESTNAPVGRERASEMKPVLDRNIALGNGYERSKACFGCEQIIE